MKSQYIYIYIYKSHNVTVSIYHLVFPAKYRRAVFEEEVDQKLREACLEIEKRYQLKFLEIGTDKDHVHFLVQSVPTYSVTKIVTILKSLTAREIFSHCPQVKENYGVENFGVMDILLVLWLNMETKI
jgi:putative transposase